MRDLDTIRAEIQRLRARSAAPTPSAPPASPALPSLKARLGLLQTHRGLRHRPPAALPDLLKPIFAEQVQKPRKRLGKLTDLWAAHAPADLLAHTALISFHRGTLTVAVDNSSRLYHLQRMLASGLEQQLRAAFTSGALRRVKLIIDADRFTLPARNGG